MYLDDDLVQSILSMVSVEAAAVVAGRIVQANSVLERRMVDERAWASTHGHMLWEIVPGSRAEALRDWYDTIVSRGDRFGILETNLQEGPAGSGHDRAFLVRIEDHEIVLFSRGDEKPLMTRFKESEIENEMYRAYSRDSCLGMMVLGNERKKKAIVKYASDQAGRILHRSTEDMIGREVVQFIHPDDRRLVMDLYSESQEGRGLASRGTVIGMSPFGDDLHLEIWMGPIQYEGAQGVYLLFNDNTSRELILNELRLFANMFNAVRIMIMSTDTDLNIRYVNPVALERLGYGFSEVIGRPITILWSYTEDEEDADGMMEELLKSGHWIGERTVRARDGSLFPVEISVSTIGDLDGNLDMLVFAIDDVSTHKDSQWKETMARKRAEFFLDLLTHDLSNYVQRIIATLDIQSTMDSKDGSMRESLEEARIQAEGIARILTPVAILSQTRIKNPLKPIDLASTIDRVLRDISFIFKERTFDVEVDGLDGEPVCVEADELIYNLILNLVDNAIRHCDGEICRVGLDVERELAHDADIVRISIYDTGPGLEDDEKNNVFFNYFRRYDGSEAKGLGLHIVKKLTERYHGNIWIDDRVPGEPSEGAKVVLELKAATSIPMQQLSQESQVDIRSE